MSIAQFRANRKIARDRRRLYVRIHSLPDSSIRDELLAVAERYAGGHS